VELLQLRYFQIVAYNQHITRSAKQLNVSQPAISTTINRLEQELGAPLFERNGRAIVLNDYGRAFLLRVNHILLEVENAKNEIQDMLHEKGNIIRLSVTSPQFLQGINEFIRLNPTAKWNQSVELLPNVIHLLEFGQIDIAITSPGFYHPHVENTVLLHDRFMVAVHPDHRLAKQSSVSINDLSQEKFIALQKGFPFRSQTDQLFADIGIEPNILMECDHYLRRELLNVNAGITISSFSAMRRKLYDPKIRFLFIDGVTQARDIVLSRLRSKYLSETTLSFCSFLKNYYQKMGPQSEDMPS
jgi:DNA-binding transcriptional LysR family regulator